MRRWTCWPGRMIWFTAPVLSRRVTIAPGEPNLVSTSRARSAAWIAMLAGIDRLGVAGSVGAFECIGVESDDRCDIAVLTQQILRRM
jgi:hypothetical protein